MNQIFPLFKISDETWRQSYFCSSFIRIYHSFSLFIFSFLRPISQLVFNLRTLFTFVFVFSYRVFLLSLEPYVLPKNENKIKFLPRTLTITYFNRDTISRAFINQYTDFDLNSLLQTSFFCQDNTNTCNFLYYSATNDSPSLPLKKEEFRKCMYVRRYKYWPDLLSKRYTAVIPGIKMSHFIQNTVENRDYLNPDYSLLKLVTTENSESEHEMLI